MQDHDVAGRMHRILERLDHRLLAGVDALHRLEVFRDCRSGAGKAVAVQHAGIQERLEDGRRAADLVKIMHHIPAARLQVCQVRHLGADSIKVGQRPLHLGFAGDGHEVQHGVGRAAQCEDERVGIFK